MCRCVSMMLLVALASDIWSTSAGSLYQIPAIVCVTLLIIGQTTAALAGNTFAMNAFRRSRA
jgi:hypothetical protein